eukprot:3675935-Prymnesium_polylepis.1
MPRNETDAERKRRRADGTEKKRVDELAAGIKRRPRGAAPHDHGRAKVWNQRTGEWDTVSIEASPGVIASTVSASAAASAASVASRPASPAASDTAASVSTTIVSVSSPAINFQHLDRTLAERLPRWGAHETTVVRPLAAMLVRALQAAAATQLPA